MQVIPQGKFPACPACVVHHLSYCTYAVVMVTYPFILKFSQTYIIFGKRTIVRVTTIKQTHPRNYVPSVTLQQFYYLKAQSVRFRDTYC